MDLDGYWQENKRFVLTVAGGFLVFLIAFLVLDSSYGAEARGSRARLAELVGRLRRLASGPGVWRLLAFAALGGAAFEGVGAMPSPLLAAHGGDAALAGRFFRLPGVLAPVLGGLVVGRLADRFGHRPALVGAALAVVAGVVALAGAAALGAGLDVLLGLLGFVYLGIGGFTASSYALFMDRTDPALGSTQFSAFMGATNLCEAWAAAAAGALAVRAGLPAAFLALAAVSLLALPLVPKSARRD